MKTSNELFNAFCEASNAGEADAMLQELWDRFCESMPPADPVEVIKMIFK
jgi:pentatricopeptide repeat protein